MSRMDNTRIPMSSTKFRNKCFLTGLLFFLILTDPRTSAQTLSNVVIEDDGNDSLYKTSFNCASGVALLSVENTNNHGVNLTIKNTNDDQEVLSPVFIREGLAVLSLPSSLFTGDTPLLVRAWYQSDSLEKTTTYYETITVSGLTSVFKEVVSVAETFSVDAQVTRGAFLTFTFFFTHSDTQDIETMTVTPCDVNALSATASMQWVSPGVYNMEISATASSGPSDSISETVTVLPEVPSFAASVAQATTGSDFYPSTDTRVLLKTTVTTRYNASEVSCVFDFGEDGKQPIEIHNLMFNNLADSTITLGLAPYQYSTTGDFVIQINCSNAISQKTDSVSVSITSPTTLALASLSRDFVLFDYTLHAGSVEVSIGHETITNPISDMVVTIDSGDPMQQWTFPSFNPGQKQVITYTTPGLYNVNVTFTAFGLNKVVTLPVRVGLLDFYIVGRPTFVKIGEEVVFELVRYDTNGSLTVNVTYQPNDSQLVEMADGVDKMELRETYSVISPYRASAQISEDDEEEEVVYRFETYGPCISTHDLFDTTYRSEDTPMPALLSAIPSISGRAQLTESCAEGSVLQYYWWLWKNTATPPSFAWEEVTIHQPEAVNLVVGNFITSEGLYRLKLNASVKDSRDFVEDIMHLSVRLPDLVAKISGGDQQQKKIGSLVAMDAALLSYDPADREAGGTGLNYAWACYLLDSAQDITRYLSTYQDDKSYKSLRACPGQISSTSGSFNVDTGVFTVNDIALFEVEVSKGGRSTVDVQVLEILLEQPPDFNLLCRWNCETKLVATDRTVLDPVISCPTCTDQELLDTDYTWSIVKTDIGTRVSTEIPPDHWDQLIASTYKTKIFESEGGWWQAGYSYTLTLEVKVGTKPAARSSHTFYTNQPPYGGSCSVAPAEGYAGETDFQFTCTDWKDEGSRTSRDP
ncbi:uncharacterized protein LOC106012387, partial [Aplysia californica]|uniref:Uncharacterized protein LOC106012387 n=1 Tax=Aplysia californica TaxID=6500 RepID=A0ABM1VWW2_APLCA